MPEPGHRVHRAGGRFAGEADQSTECLRATTDLSPVPPSSVVGRARETQILVCFIFVQEITWWGTLGEILIV